MVRHPHMPPRREGVILVVVVSLLALFAVVGLGYVMYSESAATTAKLQRESQVVLSHHAEIEPELILNRALAQLIYDVPDDQTGIYSALRGHSLARSMYGWSGPLNVKDPVTGLSTVINPNNAAFNGLGRLHTQDISGLDTFKIVNFAVPRNDPLVNSPGVVIVRDPEKYVTGPANNPNSYRQYNTATLQFTNNPITRHFGGYNVPYTYPDENNMFLAAVRGSDGQVLIPSFHRPWLFGSFDPLLTLSNNPNANLNWVKPEGRLQLLRPRPVDQLTPLQCQANSIPYPITQSWLSSPANLKTLLQVTKQLADRGELFPYPEDAGGDVKNLLGAPGLNDSVWLDINLPVRTTAGGKKYKPLVAFLITDLDGRVNLNVAGNLRGAAVQAPATAPAAGVHLHASNQGLGRWEINPLHVLTVNPSEYVNLFQGNNGYPGRYTSATAVAYARMPITGFPGVSQPIDVSAAAASFLNPRNPYDGVSTAMLRTTANQVVSGPAQWGNGFSFPNAQYDPPYYRVDLDGAREQTGRSRSAAPQAYPSTPALDTTRPLTLSSFPDYYSFTPALPGVIVSGYGNEASFPIQLAPAGTPGYVNTPATEYWQSAGLYNPLRNTGNSRRLDAEETHRMIGRYNSPLDVGESLLAQLLPGNLDATNPATAAIRHRITLVSADLGRPGLVAQTASRDATLPSAWGFNPATPNQLLPFAQQGETFLPMTSLPQAGSPAPPAPYDFGGNSLFTFNWSAARPGTPPASGARVSITDNSGNPLYLHDGRSRVAEIAGRMDLNRPLVPFPALSITGTGVSYQGQPALVQQQVQQAMQARHDFAQEIFDRLRLAVGAPPVSAAVTLGTPDFLAQKWLAQLAANIVDYIDEDDVMTRFVWNTTPGLPPGEGEVWGVEMPKVVINEVYVEQTNGPKSDPQYVTPPNPRARPPVQGRALKYQFNVFAELHHTMVPPFLNDEANPSSPSTQQYQQFLQRHAVWLANTVNGSKFSTHKLHLIKSSVKPQTVGDTMPPGGQLDANGMSNSVDFTVDPAAPPFLLPVDTSVTSAGGPAPSSYRCKNGVKNAGFYIVGPDQTDNLQEPAEKLDPPGITLKSAAMRYDVRAGGDSDDATQVKQNWSPTVVLQRLANPYLPPQPNPNVPGYNPYITVDVMNMQPGPGAQAGQSLPSVNQALTYTSVGDFRGGSPERASVVRRQPLGGAYDNLTKQRVTAGGGTVKESFFKHNATSGDNPPTEVPENNGTLDRFDWFVHLDRKLTSPMELIHVSAVPPWEVTQKFITKDQTTNQIYRQGHTATWFDEHELLTAGPGGVNKAPIGQPGAAGALPTASTRLYRALEMFRVGDRTVEMAFGGRDIGKININTIFDPQVFYALCDGVRNPYQVAGTGTGPNNPPQFVELYNAKLGFTHRDAMDVWTMMNDSRNLQARTPYLYNGGIYSQITANDMPFWGMGAAHMAVGQQHPPIPTNVAAPSFVQNAGLEATLFRKIVPQNPADPNNPKRPRLFDSESQFNFFAPNSGFVGNPSNDPPAVRHQLLEKSLLSKVFEHLTTRSNVFAVYMTVGYFEVIDDSQKPVLLGGEIGVLRDSNGQVVENKSVRHRMFAIVDRTNLSLQAPKFVQSGGRWAEIGNDPMKQGPAPFYYTAFALQPSQPPSVAPSPFWHVEVPIVTAEVAGTNVLSVSGSYNGASWTLRPYDAVYVGVGAEQRRLAVNRIMVQNLGQPYATAQLLLGVPPLAGGAWPPMDPPPQHPLLLSNALPANPGPQPDFDHRLPNYRSVVLYSVILD